MMNLQFFSLFELLQPRIIQSITASNRNYIETLTMKSYCDRTFTKHSLKISLGQTSIGPSHEQVIIYLWVCSNQWINAAATRRATVKQKMLSTRLLFRLVGYRRNWHDDRLSSGVERSPFCDIYDRIRPLHTNLSKRISSYR